jgi:hypothetical protein
VTASGGDSDPGALPARVRTLLEEGRLRAQPTRPEQVAAVWRKAVESAHDAELPGISVDGALRCAYDAGHMAALALLAAYGLRTGSGQGHHEVAFAAAAAFGREGLGDLVPDSMEIRALRKASMYDPVIAGPRERAEALAWMRRTLPAVRAALSATRPEIATLLDGYP